MSLSPLERMYNESFLINHRDMNVVFRKFSNRNCRVIMGKLPYCQYRSKSEREKSLKQKRLFSGSLGFSNRCISSFGARTQLTKVCNVYYPGDRNLDYFHDMIINDTCTVVINAPSCQNSFHSNIPSLDTSVLNENLVFRDTLNSWIHNASSSHDTGRSFSISSKI